MLSERITKNNLIFVQDSSKKKATQEKKFDSYMATGKDKVENKSNNKTIQTQIMTKAQKYLELSEETKIKLEVEQVSENLFFLFSPEVINFMQNKTKEILEVLEQELGITEKTVEDFLSQENMEVTELLTPKGFGELLSKIGSEVEAANLLVDEKFSQGIKEILEIQKEVVKLLEDDFSISKEDLDFLLATKPKEENQKSVIVAKEILQHNEDSLPKTIVKTEVEGKTDGSLFQKNESSEDSGNKENQTSDFTQGILNNVTEALENTSLEKSEGIKIIKQIVDEIKVSIKPDMTKIEMQLYPEHLGKISLQVISKDGMITAQIATQNQTVKEAIENQIIVLKQSLEEQGIKVESVEVTIASHEFEQQDQKNSDEMQQKFQGRNKKAHGVSFDDLRNESVELNETQVLEQQGSTISYSA